jgi:hypothetical protein
MQRMGRSGETGRLLGRLDALPDRAGRLKPPIWEAAMSTLTRKDVTAMFGELDDVVIAKIIATGATADELAEAHAWLANDEPLMNAGRPLPSGRVARVVDIIDAINEEEQLEEMARQG